MQIDFYLLKLSYFDAAEYSLMLNYYTSYLC